MPNGPQKITGLPFDPELYKSEYTVEDQEIQVKQVKYYVSEDEF